MSHNFSKQPYKVCIYVKILNLKQKDNIKLFEC